MRICLITNAHVSYNPRLLKEADALHEAGHEVRVVAVTNRIERIADDDRILAKRKWQCVRLNFARKHPSGQLPWLVSGVRVKLFSRLTRLTFKGGIAERAFCRYYNETLREAVAEPADLYIAHNLQALPVAAEAAQLTGGMLGFDVEDFHVDEDSPGLGDYRIRELKRYIMTRYVGTCRYLSATSEAMADALVEAFRVSRPVVLYNVFPLSYKADLLPPGERQSSHEKGYSAYWFSHVVSLDRGLQDFIRAMPLFKNRVDLYMRGDVHGNAREKLLDLAAELGIADQLHFQPPIHAEDLVRDAANHDFGLALEQPVSTNKLITVSNKMFTYLLAGIAVVATDTPGQREVMEQAAGTGILYEPGDITGLARKVNCMLEGNNLINMKRRAWEIGLRRFNWDIEKKKLLRIVEKLQKYKEEELAADD